jgi:two-component system cell cycle sensor histidine kinase/response regulator CckA
MNPSRRHPVLAHLAGPLATIALCALVFAVRGTVLHTPGPSMPLMLGVVLGSYLGGFFSGGASLGIALAFSAWYFATDPTTGDREATRRLADFAISGSALVLLMGILRRRASRTRQLAADAAVADEYRTVFEFAADPMMLSDATGRYLYVNRRACELTGYAAEELLRMRIGDLFLSLPGRAIEAESGNGEPGRLRYEQDLVRRDGTLLRAERSVRRLPDGRSLEIVRDVTAERAGVERLEHALSLVRATLDSTTDGILVVDREGNWSGHNRRFRELWSIPDALAATGDDAGALEFVVGQLADPEGFLAKVHALYATPEASSEDEIRLRDGRVFERFSIPQRIGERVIGRVWSFRDVSEARRQADALRENEQRFIQTEKLEAVGRLAGGVAHDFNNMLTAILGEADLLLQVDALDPHTRTQVGNIRSAALRGARLTRQLLAFGRRQPNTPRSFYLSELLLGLDPLIRRLAGRQVEVRFDVPSDAVGPLVHADPAQLEQAILNLVINASDAMPEGGTLDVCVCTDEVAPEDGRDPGAPGAGRYACVCVTDSGTGIPAEVRPHLFEPFFTTKPPGKGTGLGLASVHGIVRQAGGFVQVESPAGGGATFRILLPQQVGEPIERGTPSVPAGRTHVSPAGARVLVVEDEDQVRGFVVTVLRHAGYDVTASDGVVDARRVATAAAAPFDLLLSDVLMPGGNGPALGRELLAAGRVRHLLFMSGFTGPTLENEVGVLAAGSLLHKPFRSDELLQRVGATLQEPARPTP